VWQPCPEVTQEPLVVKTLRQGWTTQVSCDTFVLQCSGTVGWAAGRHLACKKLGVGMLVVMISLEL